MWLALMPFLLGFVLFFFPELTANSPALVGLRLKVGVPLLLAPLLVPVIVWMGRTITVAAQRVKLYTQLHFVAAQALNDLEGVKRSYFDLAWQKAQDKLEITKVAYLDGKIIIRVLKGKPCRVKQGDSLAVVHKEDSLLMGIFQVTEIRSQEIYAKGISHVDALWLGYIREQGETDMTPNLTAIHMPQEK